MVNGCVLGSATVIATVKGEKVEKLGSEQNSKPVLFSFVPDLFSLFFLRALNKRLNAPEK